MVKNLAGNAEDESSGPGQGRSPGEGNGSPLRYSLKAHGQRSLMGYSPWGRERVRHDRATKQ